MLGQSAIIWLASGVWIWLIISAAFDDVIDWLTAVTLLLIVVVLAAALTMQDQASLRLIGGGFLVISTIIFLASRGTLERSTMRKLAVHELARAQEAVDASPANLLARVRLAQEAYRLGLAGHAIGLMEATIAKLPKAVITKEPQELDSWKRRHPYATSYQPLPCLKCQNRVTPGGPYCPRCGAPYLLLYARGQWTAGGWVKGLLGAWASLGLGFLGIVLVEALELPPGVRVPAIIIIALGALVGVGFSLVSLARKGSD